MNSFWKQLILRTVLRNKKKSLSGIRRVNNTELLKGHKELKTLMKRLVKDIILISLGIGSAAFGLESFILPSGFIDGGATGIALLFTRILNFPLSLLLMMVNLPFIILALNIIGRQFAFKAAIAITGLALVIATVPFPEITHDKLLVSIFGGFFLGAGIGLTIRGGAVLDGTEVLAIVLSRKLGTTIGDVIIIINLLVFSSAAYFLSIEAALYSMITYLAASKTLDFVIDGIEEYTAFTIVSRRSKEIGAMIANELGRGITVYQGKSGFGNHGHTADIDIIYTVITRLEISKLNSEIEKIDPEAFVVMNSIKDTKGGMIKKRSFAH